MSVTGVKRGPYKKRKDVEVPEAVPGMTDMEAGYQQTVSMQLTQIRELMAMTAEIESDVCKLRSERDELLKGLISLRKSIDNLHRILHEGEATTKDGVAYG